MTSTIALTATLAALAESLRTQAAAAEQSAAAQQLAADRAIAAEILAACVDADLPPAHRRLLADLADATAEGDLSAHRHLLDAWHAGHCIASDSAAPILALSPARQRRCQAEQAEHLERQRALLAILRSGPAAIWRGSDHWYVQPGAPTLTLRSAASCPIAGLSAADDAELRAAEAATLAAQQRLRDEAIARDLAREQAIDADLAALLRALCPDLDDAAAAEIDPASIRRQIAAHVAPGLERIPAADSTGELRHRVSIAGYRALREISARIIERATQLATAASLPAPSLAVDRYEWRVSYDQRGWTADLVLRLGHVEVLLREVLLDAR